MLFAEKNILRHIIIYSISLYILLHIKNHYFIHFRCLFSKLLKAFSVYLGGSWYNHNAGNNYINDNCINKWSNVYNAVPNPEYIWIFGDTVYSCYCKFRLVTHPPSSPNPHGEETKMFDFDNPRLLEKALPGTELHRKLLLLTKKY